ncbi:MAG: class C sortase [Ruminococcus sp.]|nr:class C sortase [Ruminococcus sp.]
MSKETKTKKKITKSKKLLIISACFVLAGFIVMFFPNAAKFYTGVEQGNRIQQFEDNVEKAKEEAQNENIQYSTDPDLPEARENEYSDTPLVTDTQAQNSQTTHESQKYDPELLARLYSDIVKYNKDLYESGQQLLDPFAYEQESFNLAQYSVYDNIFGYVSAPSINLNLPIYLGASKDNMWLGATQMTGTSIPIGGTNTNAVLAGHRGVINMTMFDNIVFLEEGDSVFINNFWSKLEYKVVGTEIILPTESDKTKIQSDKDMLTLLTCHPYGYSSYRYIVYCERVK